MRTFQIARGCPRLTVRENLLLYGPAQPGEGVVSALLRTRAMRMREQELQQLASDIADRLKLSHVLDNKAAALSGGQKKLLEIGRALMTRPKLILLDEPIAGVNPTLARQIGERLHEIVADGISLLLIEHQMDMIARLCDHVIVMAEGRRLTEGSFARSPPTRWFRKPIWGGRDGPPDRLRRGRRVFRGRPDFERPRFRGGGRRDRLHHRPERRGQVDAAEGDCRVAEALRRVGRAAGPARSPGCGRGR